MTYKDWITKTKSDRPELTEFITKLEGFISDTGFNILKFEKAVESGLKKIESDVNKLFNNKVDAENKEDNN
jgi:hypothetical protein